MIAHTHNTGQDKGVILTMAAIACNMMNTPNIAIMDYLFFAVIMGDG
jgi:hypothetical protein